MPALCLELFTKSVIHALVFATLAMAYIGESMEDHHSNPYRIIISPT